jgi:sugar phosphate permease
MPSRWLLLAVIWLSLLVAYIDRINISVAGPFMSADLHLSPFAFGAVLSAFSLGYAIVQIPAGALADRFGTRIVLVFALGFWSLFTGLTAAATSFAGLLGIRVAFGLGEGLENGAQYKLIADVFRPRERSFANGFFLTAVALGPAFVAPLAAWAVHAVGWRGFFLLCVIPGVLMALLVLWLVPRADRVHAVTELAPLAAQTWKDALGQTPAWLLAVAYFGFNIAFWALLGWLPTYLTNVRGMDLHAVGWAASAPYFAGFVGLILVGWLGNHLPHWRALMTAACYLLAGVALQRAYVASDAMASVQWLCVAGFGLYGGFGPVWAIALDIAPKQLRGAFSGFINFGGQVGGIVAPVAVGAIVKVTHAFAGGFAFMIAGLALAMVALIALQFRVVTAA